MLEQWEDEIRKLTKLDLAITIHHGDTSVVKQGIGTFGSRSQAVGGAALHLAGGKVKAKMAKFAAALMEADERDLIFENGMIAVKGAPSAGSKPFAEVAAFAYRPTSLPDGVDPGLSEEAFSSPRIIPIHLGVTLQCSKLTVIQASRPS